MVNVKSCAGVYKKRRLISDALCDKFLVTQLPMAAMNLFL